MRLQHIVHTVVRLPLHKAGRYIRLQLGPSASFARHGTLTHSCLASGSHSVTVCTGVSWPFTEGCPPTAGSFIRSWHLHHVHGGNSSQRPEETYCVANARRMAPRGVAVEAEGLRLVHGCPVLHVPAQRSKHCPGILAEGLHHLAAVPAPKTLLKRLQADVFSRQRKISQTLSTLHFTSSASAAVRGLRAACGRCKLTQTPTSTGRPSRDLRSVCEHCIRLRTARVPVGDPSGTA